MGSLMAPHRVAFLLAASLALAGCAPDLTITDRSVQWTGGSKTASATIKNQGNKDAGPFELYFPGEECPNSSNRRPQQRLRVDGLAAGAQVTLSTDLQPLAHADNANLGRVYAVSIQVDPKNEVPESNEHNNWDSRPIQWSVTGLPAYTYNEALATILRGVQLDAAAAGELEIAPGYYKISEHRVWGSPNEKVVALHIFKDYYESSIGLSSPPRRDEAFVFSIIDRDEYDSSGRRFTGRDFHGHTLKFEMTFQATCVAVSSVALNCTTPGLTTSNYLARTLSTCGVTSEPPWSPPHPQ